MKTSKQLERFSYIWNSKWIAAAFFAVCFAFITRFTYFRPAPGIAIALMAVAAGIASLRENHWLERIGWTVVFASLLFIEFQAIKKDRRDSDEKQSIFFRDQQDSFKNITEDAASKFRATNDALELELEVTRKAEIAASLSATLARKSNLDVTGGDSFAFIYPTPLVPNLRPISDYLINIHNGGEHMLVGVKVTVFRELPRGMTSEEVEDVGTLAPHEGRMLKSHIRVAAGTHLLVYINSQTPGVQEDIYFQDSKKNPPEQPLEYRFKVVRLVWKYARKTDLPDGNHWIRILKEERWTAKYVEPDLIQGPPQR